MLKINANKKNLPAVLQTCDANRQTLGQIVYLQVYFAVSESFYGNIFAKFSIFMPKILLNPSQAVK